MIEDSAFLHEYEYSTGNRACLFSKVHKQVKCEWSAFGAWADVRAWMALALAWGMDFIHMNECGVKDVHQLRAKAKTKCNSISYMLKSFCSGFDSVHRQSRTVSEGNL